MDNSGKIKFVTLWVDSIPANIAAKYAGSNGTLIALPANNQGKTDLLMEPGHIKDVNAYVDKLLAVINK